MKAKKSVLTTVKKLNKQETIKKTKDLEDELDEYMDQVAKAELYPSDSDSDITEVSKEETKSESSSESGKSAKSAKTGKKKREPTRFIDSKKKIIDPNKKHIKFIFTWNNYPEDFDKYLFALEARYLIAGKEIGPKCGTPHLQGYCEFDRQMRIGEFAKLVWAKTCVEEGNRSTGISKFEPAYSTPIDYCSKDGDVFTYGEPKTQGQRSDIKKIKKTIKDGGTMKDVLEEATSYQSVRMAEKYMEYHDKKRKPTDPLTVIWSYGYSGTGKTYEAIESMPYAYLKGNNTAKWYQGYDGEKELILDEFRSSTMKYNELLGLLQPYPFTVETKGGSRQMKATTIWITSHYSPIEIYYNIDEGRSQLYRRINKLIFYNENNEKISIDIDRKLSVRERCAIIRAFCKKYEVDRDDDPEIQEEEEKKVDLDKLIKKK